MNFKKWLITLGTLALSLGAFSQHTPDSVVVEPVIFGLWQNPGVLADPYDVRWNKVNRSLIYLDTSYQSLVWRVAALELGGGGGGATYYAGNGLNLSSYTFSLGTPSTITLSSTNSVGTSTHNHQLDLTGYTGASTITTVGTIGTGVWQGDIIDAAYLDVVPGVASGNWTVPADSTEIITVTDGGAVEGIQKIKNSTGSLLFEFSGGNTLPTDPHIQMLANLGASKFFFDKNELQLKAPELYMLDLPTDNTETHLAAVDPVSGLVSIRPVSSISGAAIDLSGIRDTTAALWNSMYVDTIGVPLDLWHWPFSDSSQLETGKNFMTWYYPGPDSMHVDTVWSSADQSTDLYMNYRWGPTRNGSMTNAFSSAVQINGTDVTSTGQFNIPNNQDIPPRSYIQLFFTTISTKPEDGVQFSIQGRYF